jgi:hypothetical protein
MEEVMIHAPSDRSNHVGENLHLEASASELCIVVRDASSEALGTLAVPLVSIFHGESKPANSKQ